MRFFLEIMLSDLVWFSFVFIILPDSWSFQSLWPNFYLHPWQVLQFKTLRWAKRFCNILEVRYVQFSSTGCFCRVHEGNDLHYEMSSSPDTRQVLLAGLASVVCSSASESRFISSWPSNLSEISSATWYLYCDQLCLHLSHNKCFWLFYGTVRTRKG